jgi:hypothetical protein
MHAGIAADDRDRLAVLLRYGATGHECVTAIPASLAM